MSDQDIVQESPVKKAKVQDGDQSAYDLAGLRSEYNQLLEVNAFWDTMLKDSRKEQFSRSASEMLATQVDAVGDEDVTISGADKVLADGHESLANVKQTLRQAIGHLQQFESLFDVMSDNLDKKMKHIRIEDSILNTD